MSEEAKTTCLGSPKVAGDERGQTSVPSGILPRSWPSSFDSIEPPFQPQLRKCANNLPGCVTGEKRTARRSVLATSGSSGGSVPRGGKRGLPGLGWRRREWDGTVRFRRHDSDVQGPGKGEAKSPPVLHGKATDRCAVVSDRPTNPVPILEPGTIVSATPRFSSSTASLRAWHESDKSQGVWGTASPNVPSGTLPPDEPYFSWGSDANRSPRRA